MFIKRFAYLLLVFLASSCGEEMNSDSSSLSEERVIFKTGFWHENQVVRGTFQPTIISTNNGSILAFAQGRLNNSEDDTEKVLIYSKSTDEGKTWSKTEVLSKPAYFWGVCAYSYIDASTGLETISLMIPMSVPKMLEVYTDEELLEYFNIDANLFDNTSTTVLYQLTSTDDGLSWRKEIVNEDFLNAYDDDGNYIGFFTSVGQWNVITEGPYAGRFLICGPVKYASEPILNPDDIYDYDLTTSAVIYSDDQGKSWHMGGLAPHGGNESSVVAINNGAELMMVRRRDDNSQYNRIANFSNDGGLTWSDNVPAEGLPSPKCLGVMLDDGDKLLYATPKTTLRTQGWIGYSFDDGESWEGKEIQGGLFSYSDIEKIKGTNKYIVAYSLLHHGEFGLAAKVFGEDWLLQ